MFVLLLALAAQEPLKPGERLAFAAWRPEGDIPRELREMKRAGIDVLLAAAPPSDFAEALEKAGADRPPGVAPWLDGETPVDALRLFLERVPERFRATLDGKLVAVLGPPPESGRAVPEPLKDLHLLVESGWTDAPADRRWTYGRPEEGAAVWVGGEDYEKSWFAALKLEVPWVVVDGWAAARGESTARHVRKLRIREKSVLPKGKWTGAAKALYTAKFSPNEQGLKPISTEEGAVEHVQLRGVAMLSCKEGKKGPRRALAFDVDDSFSYFEKRSYTLTLEFLDLGQGSFRVEYDSADRKLSTAERHLRSAGETVFTNTGDWREVSIDLPDAFFGNGQPGGGDLRLVMEGRGIAVRRVALMPR